MDAVSILSSLTILINALKPFLPILAPLVIALLKKLLPEWLEKVPATMKPILSAAVGMLIAYLAGLAGDGANAEALVTAAGLGFGGAKVRDLYVGKPNASEV